jgi:hypothetical protein
LRNETYQHHVASSARHSAGLWYVFHDPQRRAQIAEALRHASIGWVLLGWAYYTTVEVMAMVRWQILLRVQGIRLMVQLPALNTPQFGWVKSRLPRRAQPVPPIFQPEVAAEAIYFAAHHPRREFYVGAPSVAVIVGNRFAPGLLDRYLANTAYDSQQYDGLEDPNRSHNLWQPVPGDHGAHGAFDKRATHWSPQLWTSEHRALVAIGVMALAVSGLVALLKSK